ncbi:reverse transcriptase domain-containing protein [Tanacetum coccineum]
MNRKATTKVKEIRTRLKNFMSNSNLKETQDQCSVMNMEARNLSETKVGEMVVSIKISFKKELVVQDRSQRVVLVDNAVSLFFFEGLDEEWIKDVRHGKVSQTVSIGNQSIEFDHLNEIGLVDEIGLSSFCSLFDVVKEMIIEICALLYLIGIKHDHLITVSCLSERDRLIVVMFCVRIERERTQLWIDVNDVSLVDCKMYVPCFVMFSIYLSNDKGELHENTESSGNNFKGYDYVEEEASEDEEEVERNEVDSDLESTASSKPVWKKTTKADHDRTSRMCGGGNGNGGNNGNALSRHSNLVIPRSMMGKRCVKCLSLGHRDRLKIVLDISGCESQAEDVRIAMAMTWNDFKALMVEEFCPSNEMEKLENEFWNHKMVGANHAAYTDRFHELAKLVPHLVTPEP